MLTDISVRFRRLARPLPLGLALALLCATSSAAHAAWTFARIADDTGPNDSFSEPALNRAGTAAWFSWTDAGRQAIVRGNVSGTSYVAIADNAPFYRFSGVGSLQLEVVPDVDDAGSVVFRAYTYDAGSFSYIGAGYVATGPAAFTPISATDAEHSPWLGWCNPAMSGSGRIAYQGSSDLIDGIYAGTAAMVMKVADTVGTFASFRSEAEVNDGGDVLFSAIRDDGRQGLYVAPGGAGLLVISELARDGFLDYRELGSINSAGMVAFHVQVSEWLYAIYRGDGTTLAPLVTDEGPFASFWGPSIDDDGTVAFFATLDSWASGIFTGPDPVTDKVIASGDSLFGATVSTIKFGSRGFANGRIAFAYHLDDGHEGIALATRTSAAVPAADATPARPTLRAANPAFGAVALRLGVPAGARVVRLEVMDAGGRLVRELACPAFAVGDARAEWDGRDTHGRQLSPGVYFTRLVTTHGETVLRTVLLR